MKSKDPVKLGSPKKGSKESEATADEIQEALRSLTSEQVLKLQCSARLRAKALASKSPDKDGDDLLQEAITRVLDGRRKWVKSQVPFFNFLFGVVESVASNWKKRVSIRPEGKRAKPPGMDPTSEDDAPAWIEEIAAQDENPEELLTQKDEVSAPENELLSELIESFAGDDEVLLIIEGLKDGLTKDEIKTLGWESEKKFEAADRRLRNRARKLADGSQGHGRLK